MNQREFTQKIAKAKSKSEKISLLNAYAEDLIKREKYAAASRYFEQAYQLEKKANARAYFAGQAGVCHYNLGNDREALQHLSKSAKLFEPDQEEFMPDMYGFVHFYLGSLYEYQGKVAKSLQARKVCEQYLDSQEKDTQWMLYAGLSRNYEAIGKHDDAIECSQKAIQVLSDNDPGLVYLYESMAENHMSLKEHHEAIEYFSKVLELDPNFERRNEIYLKVAHCYQRLTNHQLALESYKKILELKRLEGTKENLTWLCIEIAHCYFRLEQFETSLNVTQEALKGRPKKKLEKAEIRSYLTSNNYELGRYKEAASEGEKTLRLAKRFRNDHFFYFRLALSYFKLGDKRNFAKYRTLCRKFFPDDNWNKFLEKLG